MSVKKKSNITFSEAGDGFVTAPKIAVKTLGS